MNKVFATLFCLCALPALAETHPAAEGYCEDDRTSGWNFYCDTLVPQEEAPVPEEEPAAAFPRQTPPPPVSYTDQMMEFRKTLDELKHKAILKPSAENVANYMRAQQNAVRMATQFTEVWQRQIFADPSLDANVKRPLTAMGNNLRQDMLVAQREDALQTASQERGLMFVYASAARCMLCDAQAGIISDMAARYEISVLPVSTDGYISEHFPQTQIDQGQLARLDLEDTPLPFLALVEPQSGSVDLVGAGLMTQDIILNRVRIITAVPEGELYE